MPLLGFLLNPKFPEKVEGRFSAAPLVDLSLSPSSGLDSPNGSSSLSPERHSNGDLSAVHTAPVSRGCGSWREGVLVSWGSCNKGPQIGCLETIGMYYSVTVLEAKVQNQGVDRVGSF